MGLLHCGFMAQCLYYVHHNECNLIARALNIPLHCRDDYKTDLGKHSSTSRTSLGVLRLRHNGV